MVSVPTPTREYRRPIEVGPLDAPEDSTAGLAGRPRLCAPKVSEIKLDVQGQVVPDMAVRKAEVIEKRSRLLVWRRMSASFRSGRHR